MNEQLLASPAQGAQLILAFLDFHPTVHLEPASFTKWAELEKRSKDILSQPSSQNWEAMEAAAGEMMPEDLKVGMSVFFKQAQFATQTAIECMQGKVSDDELARRSAHAPEGLRAFAFEFVKSLAHVAVGMMVDSGRKDDAPIEKNEAFKEAAVRFGQYASSMPDSCFALGVLELKTKLAYRSERWSYPEFMGSGRCLEVGVKLALARGININLRNLQSEIDVSESRKTTYDRLLAP